MDPGYPTLPVDNDSSGKGEKGVQRRQRGGDALFVGYPAEYLGILDVISIAHASEDFADEGGIGAAFVLDRDHFYSSFAIGLVPGGEEGRFIYTIRAPGPADGDDDDLVFE